MRTGIFGGTFNPIHLAHLRIAEEVREACDLDRVLFLPAAQPPHKHIAGDVPFANRLAMVEAAIANHPGFAADDMEAQRPGASYSVHTFELLHQRFPGDAFYFIIGLDSFRDITSWKEYARLFSLTNIVVAYRPGYGNDDPRQLLPVAIRDQFCYDDASQNLRHLSGRQLIFVAETRLEISSTRIRELVAQQRSIRYLVPPVVADYISNHSLYRQSGKVQA
jgi:nicotinate-nucleotide adenylyltransferase